MPPSAGWAHVPDRLLGHGVLTARVVERARRLTPLVLFGAILLGGVVVIHACGIPGMMWRLGLGLREAVVADLVFVPGDLVKAVVATIVAAAVHRALPTLLPSTWAGRRL